MDTTSPAPPLDALRQALDREELASTAQALVRFDTSNPPGQEGVAAPWLTARLEALGCTGVRIIEAAPGRASVVGRFGGRAGTGEPRRTLIWNGHVDVVPAGDPAAWRHPPFAGQVDGGRLWGRGSADMKGAIACALEALAMLRRTGIALEGAVELQLVADEESLGSLGTEYLITRGMAQADAAICGEPTGLWPVVAARGGLWVEIETRGKSCHASTPHLGVNAVVTMARFLTWLERAPLPGSHPLLGGPTLSVTAVRGGIKDNVVPDRCTATVDRRLIPGETAESAESALQALLDEQRRRDPEFGASLRVVRHAAPSEISPCEPIVQAAVAALEQLGLGERQPTGMPGSTDARFLIRDAGIPTLIVGPGQIAEAHTVDESVALDELEQGALVYALIFARFLGWRRAW